jgi:hydrogenase-4 component C
MLTVNFASCFSAILLAIVQALFLLLLAPVLSGIARKIRAKMHSRQGPLGAAGILQDYRDILKLLQRQEVTPAHSGLVFRAAPYVLIATMLAVAATLPILVQNTALTGASDLITLIYLFALFRFFFALSGLDSGSTFAGMGASRELVLGVLVEPVLILSLLVIALIAGSTSINGMSGLALTDWGGKMPIAAILAFVACGFAVFVEMGKIPFDYPEAEQELQEGPLTEYSGVGLALVKWGIYLKQAVIASLFLCVFVPFGSTTAGDNAGFFYLLFSLIVFAVKLVIVYTLASLYENSLARGRFLLTSRVTWTGFGIAALSFAFYFSGI